MDYWVVLKRPMEYKVLLVADWFEWFPSYFIQELAETTFIANTRSRQKTEQTPANRSGVILVSTTLQPRLLLLYNTLL